MGSEIYPEVHENPRAFFNSSSLILLEPLAHGSGDWSLLREDCITTQKTYITDKGEGVESITPK